MQEPTQTEMQFSSKWMLAKLKLCPNLSETPAISQQLCQSFNGNKLTL